MKIEIWIRGRKLCEVDQNNEAIEYLEHIVRKAGYEVMEREEDRKVIKII